MGKTKLPMASAQEYGHHIRSRSRSERYSSRTEGQVSLELLREQYRSPWGKCLSEAAAAPRSPGSPKKYLIDRVAELQSPGRSPRSPNSLSSSAMCSPESMMSSPESLASPGSPYSPKALGTKKRVCEQRISWLETQAADVEIQLDKLSQLREVGLAECEERVAVALAEVESELDIELYEVRVQRELQMHELRNAEMNLRDELSELQASVDCSSRELDTAHAELVRRGVLPTGFTDLCASKPEQSSVPGSEQQADLSCAAANDQPLSRSRATTLVMSAPKCIDERSEHSTDEEWELLCARHVMSVREAQLDWLNQSKSEATRRIEAGIANKSQLVQDAQAAHTTQVADTQTSIAELETNCQYMALLLDELQTLKSTWQTGVYGLPAWRPHHEQSYESRPQSWQQ